MWLSLLALLGILFLATVVRFYALPVRGLIYWDEAKFALEGIRVQAAFSTLLGRHVYPMDGKAVGTAKPGHAVLIALIYALVGVHDYAPLYLNALASVLTVLVLFFLVRSLFDRGGDETLPSSLCSPSALGLLAALLLAVSEYDAVYARSGLSESDGDLIFLFGVLALVRAVSPSGKSRTWYLLAGLLFGASFTINYRLIVYIGFACAFVVLWRASTTRRIPWHSAPLVPGLALAPLVWQIAGIAAQHGGILLFANELTGRPTSYLAEVVYQLHEGKQAAIHLQPVPYLQWYVLRQGWPASLLVIAGLIQAVRLRTFPLLFSAALVVLPYVVYTFAPFNVPRNLEAALPFTSILAACGVLTLASCIARPRVGRAVVVGAALVLAAVGAQLAWRLTGVRSGFAASAIYVRAHDHGMALTSTELMTFYLGGSRPNCGAPAMPVSKPLLADAIAAGYKFAVSERHGTKVTHYINVRAPRAVRYLAIGKVSLGENLISSENGDPPESSEKPEWVNIYWLPALHLAATFRRPVPCPPNRVI